MDSSTIAYFDASHDLPEEIVMAAGFNPYKILGDVNKSTEPADQYLFQTFCPAARSFLTEALENPNKWAGIVVAHGCDATNRQYDIWKLHVQTPFIYWVNKPLKSDKSARKFFIKELRLFKEALEKQYNISITDEKIREAIKLSNEIKSRLRKISAYRSEKDIPNAEYFEIVRRAVQDPKKEILSFLDEKIDFYAKAAPFPSDKKRIFLTGSDVTYVEWMQLLDDAGLRVVRDDLSIGERYFANSIPEMEDVFEALVDYHFNIPKPATKHLPDDRLDYILNAVEETKLEGIVSQNVKFCEPYAYDSVFIKNALDRKKIPNIHLERDFTAAYDEQTRNRLEAFKELL